MFETAFAALFRAVFRISDQLQSADADLRCLLAGELFQLQQLGEQYMDRWFALDEQIHELMELYELETSEGDQSAWISQLLPVTAAAAARQPTTDFAASGQAGIDLVVLTDDPDQRAGRADDEVDWTQLAFQQLHQMNASFRKGIGYFDLLMFKEATQSLEQVVEQLNHPIAQIYLAASLAAQHRDDEAMVLVQQVRSSCTEDILLCAANEVEAGVLTTRGRFSDAAARLRDSCQRIPEHADVWFNLGLCLIQTGDLAAAEEAIANTCRLGPHDVEALCLLGWVQLRRGDWAATEHTCNSARSLAPRHPTVTWLQACLAEAQQDDRKAVMLCRQLIQQRPEWGAPWSMLALLLLTGGQPQAAVSVLKKRLTLTPRDNTSLLQLGVALLFGNQDDEAEQVILRALPVTSDKPLVWIALGRICARRGDHTTAQKRFARALSDDRPAVKRLAMYYQGLALRDLGQLRAAEKYLHGASLLGDPNPAILLAEARVVYRLGRHEEADRLFARAEQTLTPLPRPLAGRRL